jgi:Na+(H+)/acetate symporter ActP
MYLKPSIKPARWSSEWNFGVIALLVLAALSIAALLIMPEVFTQ